MKSDAKTYRIRNWQTFQHFKDRRPPWIKLYRDLLDDPDWHDLPAPEAKALVMLWLLASEDKTGSGTLPPVRSVAFRLRTTEAKAIQLLIGLSQWLICGDSAVISERYHNDAPETETETETEIEGEARVPATPQPPGVKTNGSKYATPTMPDALATIDGFSAEFGEYLKARKTKATTRAQELIMAKLATRPGDALAALRLAIARGWTGIEWDWFDNSRRAKPDQFADAKRNPAYLHLTPEQKQEYLDAFKRAEDAERNGEDIQF